LVATNTQLFFLLRIPEFPLARSMSPSIACQSKDKNKGKIINHAIVVELGLCLSGAGIFLLKKKRENTNKLNNRPSLNKNSFRINSEKRKGGCPVFCHHNCMKTNKEIRRKTNGTDPCGYAFKFIGHVDASSIG
jgi:hypothetical protein